MSQNSYSEVDIKKMFELIDNTYADFGNQVF